MTLTDKVLEQIMEKFGDGRAFLITEVDVPKVTVKYLRGGTIHHGARY